MIEFEGIYVDFGHLLKVRVLVGVGWFVYERASAVLVGFIIKYQRCTAF